MATKIRNCECSSWSFGNYGEDGSAESFEDYGTNCTQTTTKIFAQGHDAKLVGYLVRAELAGEEIAKVEGGIRVSFGGAVSAARSISDKLANKALIMLMAREAKIASKVAKEHGKAAPVERVTVEPTPQPRQAKIKVGRWTYDATIEPNGWATYTKKLGGSVSIASTDYTEV